MTFTVVIDLKIPIPCEPLIGAAALTFSHWLPIGLEQGIAVSEEDLELLLWFDLQSTWWASHPTAEELANHYNVLAHYIRVRITTLQVEPALVAYMQSRDWRQRGENCDAALEEKYLALGQRVMRAALKRVNRLIAYARSQKGQYWLVEHDYEPGRLSSMCVSMEARVRVNGGEPFLFQPALGDRMSIILPSKEKFIAREDWDSVVAFVAADRSSPLVSELLSNARRLTGNGFHRSALTEAVTALEVAVAQFGRTHAKRGTLSDSFSERIGVSRLDRQFEHLGLSGTINYLLPIILSESVLPSTILAGCRDALVARQNVVHNGQRSVPSVSHYIDCISSCCEILLAYGTASDPSAPSAVTP